MTAENITLICSMKLCALSSKVSEKDPIFQSCSVLKLYQTSQKNLLPVEVSDHSIFCFADKHTFLA